MLITFIKYIVYIVTTLGEEADLEAQSFSLAQKPIGSTNVQITTIAPIAQNTCYALVAFFKQ